MSVRVRVGRWYRFEAAHRLVSSRLSEEENRRVYGKCANPGGHGHNYEILVVLEGEPDPVSGLLFDRSEVDARVRTHLIDRVDHRNLNDLVEGVPTGENLALVFRRWLQPAFAAGPRLVRVEVLETARNRFTTL